MKNIIISTLNQSRIFFIVVFVGVLGCVFYFQYEANKANVKRIDELTKELNEYKAYTEERHFETLKNILLFSETNEGKITQHYKILSERIKSLCDVMIVFDDKIVDIQTEQLKIRTVVEMRGDLFSRQIESLNDRMDIYHPLVPEPIR